MKKDIFFSEKQENLKDALNNNIYVCVFMCSTHVHNQYNEFLVSHLHVSIQRMCENISYNIK